jgi:transcriptional regulator with XRE-family HTH domain
VDIGRKLKALREHKQLSQGDIQKRTGLLRCYVSRVECGHTVPAVETLEKLARALEIPLYHIFYDGEEPPKPKTPMRHKKNDWGRTGKDSRMLDKFRKQLSRTGEVGRKLLLAMAEEMSQRKTRSAGKRNKSRWESRKPTQRHGSRMKRTTSLKARP